MSTNSLETQFDTALANSPPGWDWLKPQRKLAQEHFAATGFPTTHQEEWKYTDLREFIERTQDYLQTPAPNKAPDSIPDRRLAYATDRLQIAFANGRLVARPNRGTHGLRIRSWDEVEAVDQARLLKEIAAEHEASSLTHLNTAFMSAGLVIEVADDAKIDTPIQLILHGDGQPGSAQPRILLRLGRNSAAKVIQHHFGDGPTSTNALVQANCGPGAMLSLIKLQDESATAHHLATTRIDLARDSQLCAVLVDLGAKLARNDLRVNLNGEGANAKVHGLMIALNGSHVDDHTELNHHARDTQSQEVIRGIAGSRGRSILNGKITVHPGADGTDASLSNRNLLLSGDAEIDTKPELEIYADDVKCAHGATTGKLDSSALFYLRSRGVDAETARRILITAFAGAVLEQVTSPELRQHLEDRIAAKISSMAETLKP